MYLWKGPLPSYHEYIQPDINFRTIIEIIHQSFNEL